MCSWPKWLPPLIELSESRGDWSHYLNRLYEQFCNDMVHHKVQFLGHPVGVRRIPETQGKGFGFWHCISEGREEEERIPDLDRCSRIAWIRAIIERHGSPEIDHWTNSRGREKCHLLWYNEEYLVVLAERGTNEQRYYLLKTAYCTRGRGRAGALRKERDAYKIADAAPENGV